MRAFLVNPYDRNVKEIDIDISVQKDVRNMYKYMSVEDHPINIVERAYFPNDNFEVWLDEEGLLKPNAIWQFVGALQSGYAGVGLVTGKDITDLSKSIRLDEFAARIRWMY